MLIKERPLAAFFSRCKRCRLKEEEEGKLGKKNTREEDGAPNLLLAEDESGPIREHQTCFDGANHHPGKAKLEQDLTAKNKKTGPMRRNKLFYSDIRRTTRSMRIHYCTKNGKIIQPD